MYTMSEDAKAILMLCGHLGGPSEVEPLELRDYNQVARWLRDAHLRPADLPAMTHVPALAQGTGIAADRLMALLKRGVKLGFAVEEWNQSGIWVICRSDPDYPARYKSHLKDKAPPILFGAGERSLLEGGGLAIVGSRNVDAEGDAFAREVAAWCARGGMPVVSGGARGVDQVAMSSALEAGGAVVGVLADTLLRRSVSQDARYALSEGRLLLVSPYHPEAGFSVGNAMGRNKLIYALADYGLVVSADYNKGGTWAGAQEELKREPARPVFVRMSDTVPPGNRKLTELGAVAFPATAGPEAPAVLLATTAAAKALPSGEDDLPLFGAALGGPRSTAAETAMFREPPPPTYGAPPPPTVAVSAVYDIVLPIMLAALDKPATAAELAGRLEISKSQMEAWLKRAADAHKVRKLTRPTRYARA
jgi:predicted Rossmann fold nucleotide-binding protein DprA/Smf involved in DNA uptake